MELQLDLNKRYTYAEYYTWFDDVRRELIDGFIKTMSPSPTKTHQTISSNLHRIISAYLFRKKCKVFYAPFDVRLPKNGEKEGKDIYSVVQPDLCIICDPAKLDERGCLGAPDMIIEIVSPNNSKHDVKTKFELYQSHGVKEYWIVFPYESTIYVYLLDENNMYKNTGVFAQDEKVKVNILDDLFIDLSEVFEE